MMPVQFCNYNLDYQQRLGFLKLLVWAGQGVRGGKEELQRRIESLYSPSAVKTKSGTGTSHSSKHMRSPRRGTFDPEVMLELDENPSWQPGFSHQRLDRLVLWGEMLGLITPAGRLTEWSRPLLCDGAPETFSSGTMPNPFTLSRRDRAFFLALLMYHDHPLLHLVSALCQFESGVRIDARAACVMTIGALCRTLDCASGTNIQAVRTRQSLRNLLERLAGAERIANRNALFAEPERGRALEQIGANTSRNHLAEYHAVCRFEQLTDLGLLVKDDPSTSAATKQDRDHTRKSWVWYTSETSKAFLRHVQTTGCDVECYLQEHWAKSCFAGSSGPRALIASNDQQHIAALMDAALPRARRQFGAIQVHTWVFIAALDAVESGFALEFQEAYKLLDGMRHDQQYSSYIRQSGLQTYLGRTALIMSGNMLEQISRHPLDRRGVDDE